MNQLQRPDPSAALITPSLSPHRTRSTSPPRTDHPSPTKRPRLSSAPRQLQQQRSSSSNPIELFNLHRAREDSLNRLLDVWDGLAERHSRPIDEDDIIDITTGKVIKDRGVLRGSQTWSVGAFGEPNTGDAEDDVEEDEEDDVDELDSFASGGIEFQGSMRPPPSAELDARNAEDLEQFLEAERERRELYGSEADETEGSLYESLAEDHPAYSESAFDTSSYSPAPEDTHSEFSDREDRKETPNTSEPVYVDSGSGSEDELGVWEAEASIVYRLPKDEDNDEEIEFIDRATPPNTGLLDVTDVSPEVPFSSRTNPEPASPLKVEKKANFPSQDQLQTPPQSHASSGLSATPDDDYLSHLPPPTSSPPRSSSPFSSNYGSSPIKPSKSAKKPVSERKRPVEPHNRHDNFTDPILRLDLTKSVRQRPPKPHRAPSPSPSTSAPLTYAQSSRSGSVKPKASTSSLVSPSSRTKRIPKSDFAVVIPRRASFTPARDIPPSREEPMGRKPHPNSKTKGKQKAVLNDEQVESSENDFVTEEEPRSRRSSPSPKARERVAAEPPTRGRSRQRSRPVSGSVSSPVTMKSRDRNPSVPLQAEISPQKTKPMSTPLATQHLPPTAGRKRKRVVSSAELADDSNPNLIIKEHRPRSRNVSASRSSRHFTDSEEPEVVIEPEVRLKSKQKQVLQRHRHRSLEPDSVDDYSEEEEEEEEEEGVAHHNRRYPSRGPSHVNEPYYQYPQPPPYPPQHPHPQSQPQPPIFSPFQDPRAQHIVTQAIQQIFALGSMPWGPSPPPNRGSTPFTPTHHRQRGHDRTTDSQPTPMYSTPMHQPHPYPYSYDPMLSNATLPPSSPEVGHSSPPERSASTGPWKKSLVKRSRSRGRTVSFREEVSDVDNDETSEGTDRHDSGEGPSHREVGGFMSSASTGPESRSKGNKKEKAYARARSAVEIKPNRAHTRGR